MVRPLKIDQETILEKCMLQFWKRGYYNTSISDLETALDLKRTSIYHSFGNKEGLFKRVIEYFIQTKCVYWTNILLEPDSFVTGVDDLLSTMILENFDANYPTGCLIAYSVPAMDNYSEQIREAVRQGHEIMIEGLETGIHNSISSGLLRSDTDVSALALFILNNFQGTMLLSKTIGNPKNLQEVKEIVLSTIGSYST